MSGTLAAGRDLTLVFHERVGLAGRRISPFSWRIRYVFAHKGLEPTVVPTRFGDVQRIRDLSGQDLVPIIQDDDLVVHDSWSIACHLEDCYPDRPTLFGGVAGRGVCRLITIWSDNVLGQLMRRQIYADFIRCLDPADRTYFRASREAQLGTSLEAFSAERDAALPEFLRACIPLERTLSEQSFLAGQTPAYADHVIFSIFQWARIGSPRDVLADPAALPALRAWRARMVGLHDGLADRFPGYPSNQGGPDGCPLA